MKNRFFIIIAIYLLYLSSACNMANEVEFINDNTAKEIKPMIAFGLNMEDMAIKPQDTRSVSYDIDADNAMFNINFRYILDLASTEAGREKLKALNIKDPANPKIPIHIFFKNAITAKTAYTLIFMDIVGAKKLRMPLKYIKEVADLYTDDSKDAWYAKAFLGGIKKYDNSIYFCNDYLYDITSDTRTYLTQSVWNQIADSRVPLPFPMESKWHKVSFYYNESYKNTDVVTIINDANALNKNYQEQTLKLKPIGSVFRLKVTNNSSKVITASNLDFSPKTAFVANDIWISDFVLGQHDVLINNITRSIEGITPNENTELMESAKTEYNSDGRVHYHAMDNTGRSKTLEIASNSSRFYLFWTTVNENTIDPNFETIPVLHSIGIEKSAKPTLPELEKNKYSSKPWYALVAKNKSIIIDRKNVKNGESYFIQTTISK